MLVLILFIPMFGNSIKESVCNMKKRIFLYFFLEAVVFLVATVALTLVDSFTPSIGRLGSISSSGVASGMPLGYHTQFSSLPLHFLELSPWSIISIAFSLVSASACALQTTHWSIPMGNLISRNLKELSELVGFVP